MSKLIIHSDIDDDRLALNLVTRVVADGKVSETRQGKQYCFHTSFNTYLGKVHVECTMNKLGTNTFRVHNGYQDEG